MAGLAPVAMQDKCEIWWISRQKLFAVGMFSSDVACRLTSDDLANNLVVGIEVPQILERDFGALPNALQAGLELEPMSDGSGRVPLYVFNQRVACHSGCCRFLRAATPQEAAVADVGLWQASPAFLSRVGHSGSIAKATCAVVLRSCPSSGAQDRFFSTTGAPLPRPINALSRL
ncbi:MULTISPECIES: hypothetical protein [unclassified Mesorhizobium]|uniref:hypothetical protein n=1 Tax=unclassified Mesorhizobium TaxID=325217 RepID=UPI00115D53E5|nr:MULTISPECIES: hypothetical protein [unclassified Mesorhizobium]